MELLCSARQALSTMGMPRGRRGPLQRYVDSRFGKTSGYRHRPYTCRTTSVPTMKHMTKRAKTMRTTSIVAATCAPLSLAAITIATATTAVAANPTVAGFGAREQLSDAGGAVVTGWNQHNGDLRDQPWQRGAWRQPCRQNVRITGRLLRAFDVDVDRFEAAHGAGRVDVVDPALRQVDVGRAVVVVDLDFVASGLKVADGGGCVF
jgi:hypothetical protein